MPRITVTSQKPSHTALDLVIIPVDTSKKIEAPYASPILREITKLTDRVGFTGEWGRSEVFVAPQSMRVPFVAVVGMGDSSIDSAKKLEGLRRAVAAAIIDGRQHLLRNVGIVMSDAGAAGALCEAVLFADYWFTEHSVLQKREQKARSLDTITMFASSSKEVSRAKALVAIAEKVMQGVTLTREMVNQPASHMSPTVLVSHAKKIAKTSSRISLTVMDERQAAKKKFSAFLAVARGSKEDPYVIHLKYKPAKKPKKTLVLIGKGITFDSGGLSLKPANSMEDMKIDMAGAATVLGLFSILPALDPDIAIHGIIAACENMPSGDAYRPGDVVTAMNCKKIEILNTDAEGRVTLADMLSYAVTLKPDAIVDLATLTGACVVALGDTHAGLFGNTKVLNTKIMNAAQLAGEGMVEFPLPEEYRPTVQSIVADVRNTATMKMGGAITAALFLQEFVGDPSNPSGQAIPWAHLDIAGPVYAEQPLIPYWQIGATGYGVRTLVNLVESFGK